MGFRFRKSIKIAPGVRLNVSKKGIGVSAGVKGARVSVGPSGTRVTTSIPGTGISYEQRIGNKPNVEQTYDQPDFSYILANLIRNRIRDYWILML